MSNKCGYNFDHKLFQKLIKQTNATYDDLSVKIGISQPSLAQYYSGRTTPTISALIKISDYFQVPIDVLIGRYSQEDCAKILKGSAEYMYKCRVSAFENYLTRRKDAGTVIMDVMEHMELYYAPYPYNLVDHIFAEPVDHILSEDHLEGLNRALETITPRERETLYLYFKEEKTLKEVGNDLGVTQERVRQIIAKALRKLRHPARSNLIRYGARGVELHDLEKIEEQIAEKKQRISESLEEIKKIEEENGQKLKTLELTKQIKMDELAELDLSVRSFNCLRRANCKTIDQVIELFENGTIWRVRNLGKKSIDEIIEKISDIYNIEFKPIRNENGVIVAYECIHDFKEVG